MVKMPEAGPMMRALELQRLIEDKVTEWRERSARVAGATVADSYQQPLNFKRHTHRRKNYSEINRIIAKYSKPTARADNPYVPQDKNTSVPKRPPRIKKLSSNLKTLSKSEDNLVSMAEEERATVAEPQVKPYFTLSKYNTKSCEDITVFVDVHHSMKSKNFEQNSILNSKPLPQENIRVKLHSICEDRIEVSEFSDSGLELGHSFVTSTPLSKRRTCPEVGSMSALSFEKVKVKRDSVSDLRKGSSEPNILSAEANEGSVNTKTLDFRKRWKMLKPRKGAFDFLLLWRGKKPKPPDTKPR